MYILSIQLFRLQVEKEKAILPDSIRDNSNMSFMSFRRSSQLLLMVLIKSAFSSSDKSSSLTNRLEKPTIALSGVRISWLILARNDCLSSASIARSLAFINSSSLSLKCCTLVTNPMMEAVSAMAFVGLT